MPEIGELQLGYVVDFDGERGLGTVARSDNSGQWKFHCTQIRDGSRHIEPDAPVCFWIRAGGPGQWEAVAVASIRGSDGR